MQRGHTIANDVNLLVSFKFVWMQECQFAARAEKIYITRMMKSDGKKARKDNTTIKSTAPG